MLITGRCQKKSTAESKEHYTIKIYFTEEKTFRVIAESEYYTMLFPKNYCSEAALADTEILLPLMMLKYVSQMVLSLTHVFLRLIIALE